MPPLPLHLHLIFTGYRKKNTLGKAANDDPYASIKIEQILKKKWFYMYHSYIVKNSEAYTLNCIISFQEIKYVSN